MNAIPAIAAYESWNPTSRSDEGDSVRCISRAAIRTVPVLLKRPHSRAVSPMRMNRNALTIDAPAPVARVYRPHARTIVIERAARAEGLFPSTESSFVRMPYIIPRCSPDRARICEAPLSRNASVMCLGISVLSPIIRAFMMAFVSGLLNPMLSIISPVSVPKVPMASMMPAISGPPADVASDVIPQMMPQDAMQTPMMTLDVTGDADVWRWWSRKATETRMTEKASAENMWRHVYRTCTSHKADAAPAANGNAIPVKSLSTSISYRIFAKIAINFYNFAKIG